jgi:hypothetical protein
MYFNDRQKAVNGELVLVANQLCKKEPDLFQRLVIVASLFYG